VEDVTGLARRAAQGDRDALADFVRATQADVWRLCARLGGRDVADDLTQETYLRALPALPSFRGDASARTWILAIARRTVADAIRGSTRRRRVERDVADTAPGSVASDASGAISIHDAVDGLDDDQRAAFVLTQVLGLSYAETATVCGCPVGTIRSRLARAREQLVAALGESTEPDSRTGER
jgi:RNA polymerase sigma-70 factor (ECF subfamily)